MRRLLTLALAFLMVAAVVLSHARGPAASAGVEQASASSQELDRILDRYVQAVGGRDALGKLTSRRMKGRVSQAAARVAGQVQIDQKAPNKWLEKEVFIYAAPPPNDHSERRMGFNGKVGWSESDDIDAGTLGERNLAFDLERPLSLKGLYRSLKLNGMQQVESDHPHQQYRAGEDARDDLRGTLDRASSASGATSQAYVIEATKADGNIDKLYFDIKTGLLLRCDLGVAPGRYGLTWYFEQYREVDGVQVPHRLVYRQNFSGNQVDTIFDFNEIYQNIAIDDAEFEKPRKSS
jgi:hypothetical protein